MQVFSIQVQDVLKVVGLSTLDSFPWGIRIADLVNSFLPVDQHLSGSSTGEDLQRAIEKLSEAQREVVLSAKVSLRRGDLPAETQEIIETGRTGRLRVNPGILVVGLICVIAFVLTVSLSLTSYKTGNPADTSGLISIVQILAELAKALLGGSTSSGS